MKGYKAVNKNNTSKQGDNYILGQWYYTEEKLAPGESGFHFCDNLESTLFHFDLETSRFFEIETGENVVNYGEKFVTDSFRLVRELSKKELVKLVPTFFSPLEKLLIFLSVIK